MRSSTAVGLAAARGRFTSMPRYIIGAVSMKMSRSTRTTSTSGMMLISASEVPRRRESEASVLNAIFGGPRHLGDRTAHDVEQVEREAVHLRGPVLHAIDEVVVANDGGNGGGEAGGRRHQRLRDARR